MEFINVTSENIDKEHICCAISEIKGENCVALKKAWLKAAFKEGLVFKKLDARGKVFIEYIPSEKAWCPIEGDNYLYVDCFWVSGKFKGQGYGSQLLEACCKDAKEKGKSGIVILSSEKKKPFLSDPIFLKKKGFLVGDKANPYFELLYLPLVENPLPPKFKAVCKKGTDNSNGWVLYYSDQCPHTEKYGKLIQKVAEENGVEFKLIKFNSFEEAQESPSPFTTYSLFYNGQFVTNEILSEKKFKKFLDKNVLV